jgi:hypothetical protein
MTPIRVWNGIRIDLGSTVRLEIWEDTDGDWNIKVVNPRHVRIGTETAEGITYKYVQEAGR